MRVVEEVGRGGGVQDPVLITGGRNSKNLGPCLSGNLGGGACGSDGVNQRR